MKRVTASCLVLVIGALGCGPALTSADKAFLRLATNEQLARMRQVDATEKVRLYRLIIDEVHPPQFAFIDPLAEAENGAIPQLVAAIEAEHEEAIVDTSSTRCGPSSRGARRRLNRYSCIESMREWRRSKIHTGSGGVSGN